MEPCSENQTDQPEADVFKRDVLSELSSTSNLQNSVLDEKEHLQVYLRVRPFSTAESNYGEARDCVTVESADTVLVKPPSSSLSARLSTEKSLPQTGQRFQFSQVYGPETTQKQLFEGTVKDLVKDVVNGGNSLVFTYGVTNAGKTFTFLGPDADAGILPRSIGVIFNSIKEHVFTGVTVKPHRCREFIRLTKEQQVEEILFKRNLFKQAKLEGNRGNASQLNSTIGTFHQGSIVETTVSADDRILLEVEEHTKFSVWVSFCEIYNENIHDLLEAVPSWSQKRPVLRLSQDIKGNSFVKDLRWVQVNSAEEAYSVMKLGKRNQSFSSTRLNQLSSRSHSIFSIRIMRLEDVGTLRVNSVSELCLCDLAGSERCAKTQNKGERLKEAGNINSSLLILGKCITALRHNQQAKLLQHVPYRESKLTHYLQGFFCGRGKACMIVNINQCASMYDETLNVLKFSAVAQKVVVLNTKVLPIMPERSSNNASFFIDGKLLKISRRSSLNAWETSLEDVQEDEGDEYEEEVSLMEDTTQCNSSEEDNIVIDKNTYQSQRALLAQLQDQLKKQSAESMQMEARLRDEICKEFSELFTEMQIGYNERLAREKDILEVREETRLEIFKKLIDKMAADGPIQDKQAMMDWELAQQEEQAPKRTGETSTKKEEKSSSLCQIEEKSLQVASLEKDVAQLQRLAELNSQSQSLPGEDCKTEQLQDALAAVEKEKQGREEALTALEFQTIGKEEALASLKEERKAREKTITALSELRQLHDDMLALFEEEKKSKETILATLEAERRAKGEAIAALAEERQQREEALGLKRTKTDNMEEQNEGIPVKTPEKGQQECDLLRQELNELTAKLEVTEKKVSTETERGEQVFLQLQAALKQPDQLSSELHEKTTQIQSLTQEVEGLKQELQTSVVSSGGMIDQLKEEASELLRSLAEEKEKNNSKNFQVTQLEKDLTTAKEQLSLEQLMSEKKLKELREKLDQQLSASKEDVKELRKKLEEKDGPSQRPLDELRAKLKEQERASKEEVERIKAKLKEQTQTSEKQTQQLKEKMQEQEAKSKEQLETLQHKLNEQQAASDQLLSQLKQQLSEHEQTAEKLRAELRVANTKCSTLEEHNQTKDRVLLNEQADRVIEMKKLLDEKEKLHEQKLTESVKTFTELQMKLSEKESEVALLQKGLKQAQERCEEEESQAVQETRRREVERRRELLATAHEAIALKDAELEKKTEEINRLRESAQQDADKVKSLAIDLQRKEDDSADLREKLADYKKQIQQVQKEISSMREEEKGLKQRLCDMEKSKKQLQADLASRDRTIQQLKDQSSDAKSEKMLQLYQKAHNDLDAKECVIQDMRLVLMEQEETQKKMEQGLEESHNRIQELSCEVERLKSVLVRKDCTNTIQADVPSNDLKAAKEEAAQAQENLKSCVERHRTERKNWMEEKLSLIGQAKEAEDKRNQEMKRYAEDRERYNRQHAQQESLLSQLAEKEETMEKWRKDRDTLVAALEVQLQKLLTSQAGKDKLIQQLQQNGPQLPQEGSSGVFVAELQAALSEREAEIQRLKEELKASTVHQDSNKKIKTNDNPMTKEESLESEVLIRKSRGRRDDRASVSSQGSASCPSVLDSLEISTENGRTSRFPRPELEISFSPLQPNRMALRRQGEQSAITVKITRSARKRKSNEMEKEEVVAENRRNTRTKVTPKMTPYQEEKSTLYGRHDSQSSRKEGTLQKIGDFLQSSPTLLGSKAKKVMGLVSGRGDLDSTATSSSLTPKAKKKKRKLYRPEISSPMDMPPHPIISREPEERESDHQIIKRRLRSRVIK